MSRNDEERLGITNAPVSSREQFNSTMKEAEVIQAPKPVSSNISQPVVDRGLVFVNPTKPVVLPSKGEKYPEDHPLYCVEEIEIKQMTTNEENILTNHELIRSGMAIDEFLRSVIVDRRIDPQSLLTGDRTAILVASRIYGYGSNYVAKVRCPICGSIMESAFDLKDAVENGLEALEQIEEVEAEFGVVWTGKKTFKLHLDTTGWDVECKLTDGRDEKINFDIKRKRDIQQKRLRKKNKDIIEVEDTKHMSEFLRSIIVSIDGNDGVGPRKDKGQLNRAIDSMPTMDIVVIKDVYKLINPRIALLQELYCEKCNYEGVIDVPINENFFRVI